MSADVMEAPIGEVLLDGRVLRPDGSWSGVKAAGEVVRGTVGDAGPTKIIIPAGTAFGFPDGFPDLSNEVGAIIPYTGAPPQHVRAEPVADVYWYETFMERLMRDVERGAAQAS